MVIVGNTGKRIMGFFHVAVVYGMRRLTFCAESAIGRAQALYAATLGGNQTETRGGEGRRPWPAGIA